MDKIKILFLNTKKGGINYFRTETPAIQLKKTHSDIFDITIKNNFKFDNIGDFINDLKLYDIIHYHQTIINDLEKNLIILNELKNNGVKLIMDIDDYWVLEKTHPLYEISIKSKLKEISLQNIKNCDYITTTTENLANEIKKYNKNVIVCENGVNPEIQSQFKSNNKFDRDLITISYIGSSSHLNDLQPLNGTINLLNSDNLTNGKFRVLLGGFDIEGTKIEKRMNQDFIKILKMLNLYNDKILKKIKLNNGKIDNIDGIPIEVKNAFKNGVIVENKRKIKPEETPYYFYEKILTDNYKLIENNSQYINYLNKFIKEKYIDEDKQKYIRRWTEKENKFAFMLDETDILLAPLADNKFNNMKSNLKQIEASTRKIPVICSDVIPYNVDGINNENCILIKESKNQDRKWYKRIKKLILDKELRIKLGNNLHRDFNEKYNLKNINDKRVNLYLFLM